VTARPVCPDDERLRKATERRRVAGAGSTRRFLRALHEHSPSFREHDVPYDEKLIYAYVRGKHFKGVEDPTRTT
jgi:hypothetical protein